MLTNLQFWQGSVACLGEKLGYSGWLNGWEKSSKGSITVWLLMLWTETPGGTLDYNPTCMSSLGMFGFLILWHQGFTRCPNKASWKLIAFLWPRFWCYIASLLPYSISQDSHKELSRITEKRHGPHLFTGGGYFTVCEMEHIVVAVFGKYHLHSRAEPLLICNFQVIPNCWCWGLHHLIQISLVTLDCLEADRKYIHMYMNIMDILERCRVFFYFGSFFFFLTSL